MTVPNPSLNGHSPSYPKRPKYFAYRFCRLVAKTCLANDAGPEVCWLLTVVAMTEDAKHYTGPVTFYNDQLRPLIGVRTVQTLDRIRQKAIDAGWLVYTRNGRRSAGRYWVQIPAQYLDLDDAPSDEFPEKYGAQKHNGSIMRKSHQEPESNRETTGNEPESNRELNPSHLIEDYPIPVPVPAEPRVGEKYQTPNEHQQLFAAIAEVTGADPALNVDDIGDLTVDLLRSHPPFTPDQVRDFGKQFHRICPWASRDSRLRPTLNEVKKYISQLRAQAPKVTSSDTAAKTLENRRRMEDQEAQRADPEEIRRMARSFTAPVTNGVH